MTKIDVGWIDPGNVTGHFAHSIANQIADMQYFGAFGKVHASIGTSILAAGRNLVVEEFLRGDSDYLWMVDTDMVFNKGHWLKLVTMAEDMDADMVTGLAFIYKQPTGELIPSLFYQGVPDYEPDEYVIMQTLPENGSEIAACGLASALVHRRVFETLEAPRHEGYRWFDQIIMPSGRMSGEDVQFFHRARQAGFTLRVCTEAKTSHIKEVGMGEKEFLKHMELKKVPLSEIM